MINITCNTFHLSVARPRYFCGLLLNAKRHDTKECCFFFLNMNDDFDVLMAQRF